MSTADAMRPRVLVTDDEPGIRKDLSDYLSHLGYDVSVADDGGSTLSQVTKTAYDVLLLDDMLPDESGLEILPRLLDVRPSMSVIVMTGFPTIKSVIRAMRTGACDFIVKPFELAELKTAVHRAVQRNQRLVDGAFRNCKDATRDSRAVMNSVSQD